VCLSEINVGQTPSAAGLDILRAAGLGRKKIVFRNKKGNHEHIRQTLESYFPRNC